MTCKSSFFALIVFVFLTACMNDDVIQGEGEVLQQGRELPSFTEIVHNTVIPVYLIQDSIQEVILQGSSSLLPYVDMDVQNGVLAISLNEEFQYHNLDVSVYIRVPKIEKISLRSTGDVVFLSDWECSSLQLENRMSANIESLHTVKAEHLSIYQELSSSINLNIKASHIEINAIDASNLILSGEVDNVTCHLSQTAQLNAFNMLSKRAIIYHHSTKTVKLTVSEILEGRIGSTGDIWYHGNPVIHMDIQGTGAVIPF